MKATYFINRNTGEYTENHAAAVRWLCEGDAVNVYDEKGRCRLTWLPADKES